MPILAIIGIVLWISSIILVVSDAPAHNQNPVGWGIAVFLFPGLGLLLYAIFAGSGKAWGMLLTIIVINVIGFLYVSGELGGLIDQVHKGASQSQSSTNNSPLGGSGNTRDSSSSNSNPVVTESLKSDSGPFTEWPRRITQMPGSSIEAKYVLTNHISIHDTCGASHEPDSGWLYAELTGNFSCEDALNYYNGLVWDTCCEIYAPIIHPQSAYPKAREGGPATIGKCGCLIVVCYTNKVKIYVNPQRCISRHEE